MLVVSGGECVSMSPWQEHHLRFLSERENLRRILITLTAKLGQSEAARLHQLPLSYRVQIRGAFTATMASAAAGFTDRHLKCTSR